MHLVVRELTGQQIDYEVFFELFEFDILLDVREDSLVADSDLCVNQVVSQLVLPGLPLQHHMLPINLVRPLGSGRLSTRLAKLVVV